MLPRSPPALLAVHDRNVVFTSGSNVDGVAWLERDLAVWQACSLSVFLSWVVSLDFVCNLCYSFCDLVFLMMIFFFQ
jgi:hypothetical protein